VGAGGGVWRGLASVPVDEFHELSRGACVGIIGEVPRLSGGVAVFAEDGEAFADVGNVGVGVRLVGVAEHGGALSGDSGRKDAVAEVGLGAAAEAEVVRGASDSDSDPPGPVRGEQLGGHPATQLPFLVCAA
jgi:hypothetical protein